MARSYLKLCPDVTKMALGYLNFSHFQSLQREETKSKTAHPLFSYGERFKVRYGSKLPEIDGLTFATEEDHYLFCAGYEHREVGLRSHLYLSPFHCFQGALLQGDVPLLEYFQSRLDFRPEYDPELLRIAVTQCEPEMLMHLEDLESWRRLWDFAIPRLDVLEVVLKSPRVPAAVFSLARDHPLADLLRLVFARPDSARLLEDADMELVMGLAASGDPEKMRLAQQFLRSMVDKFLSSSEGPAWIGLRRLVRAMAYLDDLEAFQDLWPQVQGQLSIEDLVFTTTEFGAAGILQWLLNQDIMMQIKPLQELECNTRYALRPEKLPAVIELLQLFENPQLTDVLMWLYAVLGDRRVLGMEPTSEHCHQIALELLRGGHASLLIEYYQLVLIPAEIATKDPKLVLFVLDHELPAIIENFSKVEVLSYRQWQQFYVAALERRVVLHDKLLEYITSKAPTLALFRGFTGLAQEGIRELVPPYLTFRRHTKKVLFAQIKCGNIEYVRYYFKELARGHRIRHYTGYPASAEMRALLEAHKVRYDEPENKEKGRRSLSVMSDQHRGEPPVSLRPEK